MKIIDKTPLVDEKGELGFAQRVQGMLKFGLNWSKELQAQKAIVNYFDRQLQKGYTIIRNMSLGESGIMIPMILLGPAGIFVISVSYLKGRYEAKGESWNVDSGNGFKPAPVNLVQRTQRMARALQVYIERQGTKLPTGIEPVLIAGDPGLHIESERPSIRVVMLDGVKSFVNGLATGRPVIGAESVFDMTERILNPRPPRKESPESVAPTVPPTPRAAWEQEPPQQEVSRARAIFSASEQAKPFDPADFDFAMTDEEPLDAVHINIPVVREGGLAKPVRSSRSKARRIFGMTVVQFLILAVLVLCLISVLIVGFVYINPLGL